MTYLIFQTENGHGENDIRDMETPSIGSPIQMYFEHRLLEPSPRLEIAVIVPVSTYFTTLFLTSFMLASYQAHRHFLVPNTTNVNMADGRCRALVEHLSKTFSREGQGDLVDDVRRSCVKTCTVYLAMLLLPYRTKLT